MIRLISIILLASMLVGSVRTNYLRFVRREMVEIVETDFSSFESAGANGELQF